MIFPEFSNPDIVFGSADFSGGTNFWEEIDDHKNYLNELNQISLNTTVEKIIDHIESIFQTTRANATDIQQFIFLAKDGLVGDEAITLAPAEDRPREIIVTRKIAFVINKFVGNGTSSDVYNSTAIAFDRVLLGETFLSPSKPQIKAIKMSRTPKVTYSPEKRRLDSIHFLNRQNIDYPLDTYKEKNKRSYSVHELFEDCLSKTSFANHPTPALAIIQAITPLLERLDEMHKSGWLHRDIKGDNILVSKNNNTINSALTDFGLLQREQSTLHQTTGTVSYLDPRMFGNAEESLINQKLRKGRHDPAGDIYAFGQTMIYDILFKFIREKSEVSKNKDSILNSLDEIDRKGSSMKFRTNDELKEIGNSHPHRSEYLGETNNGSFITYPSLETYNTVLAEIFQQLNDCLAYPEIEVLTQITRVALYMKTPELTGVRPTAKQAVEYLKGLTQRYNRSLRTNMNENRVVPTFCENRPCLNKTNSSRNLANRTNLISNKENIYPHPHEPTLIEINHLKRKPEDLKSPAMHTRSKTKINHTK